MAPKPHDQKISPRSGPPMNRTVAANRSIPVPGGFLVAISYPHDATPRSQGRTSEKT
jgi:hypothetical protein